MTYTSQDVWQKLQDQMEQMNAALAGKSDPQALARKLSERAKSLRQRMGTESTSGKLLTFVAFRKGPQRYGIPVSDVVEVQTLEHFSPVPGAPAFIRGVIHWRGSILSLLDLSRLLEIQETGIADLHTCIIAEVAGRRIAIAAGEIEELLNVPETQVRRVPELPGGIPVEWFVGVYDENRLILKTPHLLEDPRFVEWK